jgi:hypothetical protein
VKQQRTSHLQPKSSELKSLDRILESAVVINWNNLIREVIPGLIHVECDIAEERFMDNVRIWSSTPRGYWSLVRHSSSLY